MGRENPVNSPFAPVRPTRVQGPTNVPLVHGADVTPLRHRPQSAALPFDHWALGRLESKIKRGNVSSRSSRFARLQVPLFPV